MNNRPKIKLALTNSDRLIEFVGWTVLMGVWILTLCNYTALPETIPIHFNAAGKVDGVGNKWNLLTLPLISTVLFVGMTILNRYPHVFNYLSTITEENALGQYTNATRLIRLLKLGVVLIFGLIAYKTIQHVKGTAIGLGIWFLPLTMGLLFIPIAYYLMKSIPTKRSKK